MKMNILPFYLEEVPEECFEGQDQYLKEYAELRTLAIEKLTAIIELSYEPVDKSNREHLTYHAVCNTLGLQPLIRLKTKTEREPKVGSIEKTRSHILKLKDDKYMRLHGYSKADQEKYIKRALDDLKEALKNARTGRGIGISYSDTSDCMQCWIWEAIRNRIHREGIRWSVENYQKITPELLRVLSDAKRLIGTRTGITKFEKQMERFGFYLCGITQELKNKKEDPQQTIIIFSNWTDWKEYKNVATSTLENGKYQKLILKDKLRGFKELDGQQTYVDTRSAFCKGEDIVYDQALNAWKEDTSPNKWLCVGERVNAALLNYSAQPVAQKPAALVALGTRTLHYGVGFEIEFQDKYSKQMAIKNKDGRPLTPSKVLEDFGWAICPDSSVAGGELKSPVLFFSGSENVKMLLKQIPQEIRDFINAVAKDGHCGGHLNLSHGKYNATNVMMAIASWGFIWPMLCDDRLTDKKLVNKHGEHYCDYRKIEDPFYKYQWIRLKARCMEVRTFAAHWDVDTLLWRAKLVALMMEDVEKQSKQDAALGVYTVLNYHGWDHNLIGQMAVKNWESFANREHPIREHLRTVITGREIAEKIETESFRTRVSRVLNLNVKKNNQFAI